MSDAIKGYGSTFKRGDGASPESFTTIAETITITPPQLSRETFDKTHLNSPDQYNEFGGGMRDGGEVTFTMAYVDAGTGQSDIRGDFDADTVVNYQVVYPDGAQWDVSGLVTGIAPSELSNDERISESVTIKVSGKPTFTAAV